METEDQLRELAAELRQMARAVATNPTIPSADLRRVLRFLTKVLEVVDQSFQDVYGILIEIQFLTPVLVNSGRVEKLQEDLQNVFSRSRFRDAEEICSRLHHLGETYQQSIRPIVEQLQISQQWYRVFSLLSEHEGRIIRMIQDAVHELRSMLSSDLSSRKLSSLKRTAREKAESLRSSLSELQDLRNRILGISGRTGFLELTEVDRNQLQREMTIMIDKSDRSVTHGARVTLGDGTVVHGPIVVAEQIRESFNTAENAKGNEELRDALKTLCAAVAQFTEHLPPERATEVSRDLDSLVKEATSEKPRRKWYELSSQGLIDAANAVGAVAKPVVAAAKTVLSLLAGVGG